MAITKTLVSIQVYPEKNNAVVTFKRTATIDGVETPLENECIQIPYSEANSIVAYAETL